MTSRAPLPAPATVDSPRATLRAGGVGLLVAGALLVIGGIVLAQLPSPTFGAVWLVLAFPLGGVTLLVASTLLAVGARGEDGLVGRGRLRRIALIVSGAGPLVLSVAFPYSFLAPAAVQYGLTALQLLILAAGSVVGVALLRDRTVRGVARGSWTAFAVIDAVALVLAVVPLTFGGFLILLVGVRPVAVVVVGVLLVLEARDGATSPSV